MSKPPKRVLLESPYAGDIEANREYLQRCIRHSVLSKYEAPFASHQMYTQALDDDVPHERAMGIDAGFAWGAVAEAAVFYLDRGMSRGMRFALLEHLANGLPIEFRMLDSEVNEEELYALLFNENVDGSRRRDS